MLLTLDALLIIVLCVATAGLATTRLFQRLKRPYLLTIAGTPRRLLAVRLSVWLAAALTSVAVWTVLFAVLNPALALALFFGVEAFVLDICTQRIVFCPVPAQMERVPVRY